MLSPSASRLSRPMIRRVCHLVGRRYETSTSATASVDESRATSNVADTGEDSGPRPAGRSPVSSLSPPTRTVRRPPSPCSPPRPAPSRRSPWRRRDSFDDAVNEARKSTLVQDYARMPQTPVSLQQLLKTGRGELLGKSYLPDHLLSVASPSVSSSSTSSAATQRILIHMASLLRHELPIRLAHRIQDLERVPLMKDMPSVQAVSDVYRTSFERLLEVPPISTAAQEAEFAHLLHRLYDQHSSVLVQMAQGAAELREALRSGRLDKGGGSSPPIDGDDAFTSDDGFARLWECHAFLDRFYLSRIGIRVLVGQYLALRDAPRPHYTGLICHRTSPRQLVQQAADVARHMGRHRYHGRAPLVQVSGRLDLTFPYVPTYLHYVLLELLKNAVRATCEAHPPRASGAVRLPPVQVVIADGCHQEDVVIKVSDEGGGIPRSQMDKIWSYLYTTADPAVQQEFVGRAANGKGTSSHHGTTTDTDQQKQQQQPLQDHSAASPIAGLGYGLPISRSYCRYFGGQLDLVSMEGFGTDAFVHLKRLGDADEPLEV